MPKSWRVLKEELEEETKKINLTCPDEIKRYHYGLITHSDAGKYALNQYFGHWVHNYGAYFSYSYDILGSIRRLAKNPVFSLEHVQKMFSDISKSGNLHILVVYGGQKSLGKYIDEMVSAFPTLQTKEEFMELLDVFMAYVGRLYSWLHWYFPWGIGPVLCRRLTPDDVKEIVRLSTTT